MFYWSLFSLGDRLKHKLRIDLIYYWFYSLNIVNLWILRNMLWELLGSVSLWISCIREPLELSYHLSSFLIFSESSFRLWNLSDDPFNLISIAHTLNLRFNHLISFPLSLSDKKNYDKSTNPKCKNNKIENAKSKYFSFIISYYADIRCSIKQNS